MSNVIVDNVLLVLLPSKCSVVENSGYDFYERKNLIFNFFNLKYLENTLYTSIK